LRAAAHVSIAVDERGRSSVASIRGEAPLLVRRTTTPNDGAVEVHLVGGAAGPLGGDELTTTLEVGERAQLRVRSVAASLAQPGATHGATSHATVHATVGSGATLDWWPEPLVSVAGSRHVQTTTVELADESVSVRWVDEVVLGRYSERSGELTLHQRFTVGGRPLVHHTMRLGPNTGEAAQRRFRVVVSAVQLGGATPRPPVGGSVIVEPMRRLARLEGDTRYTMWLAFAGDLEAARSGLSDLGLE
jgi:urease accessory protein